MLLQKRYCNWWAKLKGGAYAWGSEWHVESMSIKLKHEHELMVEL